MEKCVQNAGPFWKERVQLSASILHPPTRYQVAQEGLGRLWKPSEMDCEAGEGKEEVI